MLDQTPLILLRSDPDRFFHGNVTLTRISFIAHKELARRLDQLESRIEHKLEAQDDIIFEILGTIRQLMMPPEPKKKRPIGFVTPEEK
jgi:hypothetical protein